MEMAQVPAARAQAAAVAHLRLVQMQPLIPAAAVLAALARLHPFLAVP